MAGPQTTRELWVAKGPFKPYEVQCSRARHVPEPYLKLVQCGIVDSDESYHAHSRVENDNRHYPVKFNISHVCWAEVCWVENFEAGGHWEAYCITGEDLGLNITSEDVDCHLASQQTTYRVDNIQDDTTPSRANTPSKASNQPSIIHIHESPTTNDITRLAAALHIEDFTMSQTTTTMQTI